MNRLLTISIALCMGIAAFMPATAQAMDDCDIHGMITAEITNDPGFEGLYKYSITFWWDTSKGLSHTDVFLDLENCECICDEGIVLFPSPAAESTGELPDETECTAEYEGDYVCMGDPTIPQGMGPAVKWDAVTGEDGCEPGKTGMGYACFYSPLPPSPINSLPEGIGVKAGQDTCLGPIDGVFPMCDCTVQIEVETWGGVKSQYR